MQLLLNRVQSNLSFSGQVNQNSVHFLPIYITLQVFCLIKVNIYTITYKQSHHTMIILLFWCSIFFQIEGACFYLLSVFFRTLIFLLSNRQYGPSYFLHLIPNVMTLFSTQYNITTPQWTIPPFITTVCSSLAAINILINPYFTGKRKSFHFAFQSHEKKKNTLTL